jgi:hypothetical protein
MEITDTGNYIRQQNPGQFRRPEDGKEPFAHVNGQKLDSTVEEKKCSVYIDNENVVTFEKDTSSYFPKLFDFDAGMKSNNTEIIGRSKKEEKSQLQYEKTAKPKNMSKEEMFVDQWA